MRARALFLLPLLFAVLAASGCQPAVDLTKNLEVRDVTTGWFDAGIVDGQNKLVPSISFKLKNLSNQTLVMLQVNAVFRRGTENEDWGSGFLTAAGTNGLAPGAVTDTITLRSDRGYKGTDSRQEMLHNSQFVDAKVRLSAKYGSSLLAHIGEYPVTRELITR